MDWGAAMNNPGGAAAAAGNAQIDLMSWYMEIPLISRLYLTGAFLTTAACAVDVITPFSLYFSWELVVTEGQVWRLLTSYLFFGVFSVDFLFHMYFLVRYSRLLEEGEFRNQTAKYVWMILFGWMHISWAASYLQVHFLGSALTFMMAYVWGRRNEDVKMSFLGFITFHAPYLPWVMLAFSVLIGNAILMDVLGIAVGHWYYFWEFVYPVVADVRAWPLRRVLEPPRLLQWMCGEWQPPVDNGEVLDVAAAGEDGMALDNDGQQRHLHQD